MSWKTFIIGAVFGLLVLPTLLEASKSWMQKGGAGQLGQQLGQLTSGTHGVGGAPPAGAGTPSGGWYY
jgi:hypothetical protein